MNKVPFYDDFNDKFPSIVNPNLTIDLKLISPCFSVGSMFRSGQLLTTQMLAKIDVRKFSVGIYQQPSDYNQSNNKTIPDIPKLVAYSRAVVSTSVGSQIGEIGFGLILPGTIISNRELSIDDIGIYLSNRTENSSVDVQAMQHGCTINFTTRLNEDLYLGSSYSNLMDSGSHSGTLFLSKLSKSMDESSYMIGINILSSVNDDTKRKVIGQLSTPYQTRFGDMLLVNGFSIDTSDKTKSTLTLSGKQTINQTGFSLVASTDFNPFRLKKINSGMLGVEYSPKTVSKFTNIGFYLDIVNSPNEVLVNPKFGINLKF